LPDSPTPSSTPRAAYKWIVVCVAALAAIGITAALMRRPKPPARPAPAAKASKPPGPEVPREIRKALWVELQPVTLANCTMQRFGGSNDGGYLMCGNLLRDVRSAYSYGIGTDDNWGCQISKQLGVPVHEYDCFNPAQPACPGGSPVFHNECIGPKPETLESRVFDTLSRQIERNGDSRRRLVVKIDVEGAELESLLATPSEVLERFDQLTMEIHGVSDRFVELVRMLKRTFHVVHLHYNNNTCDAQMSPLGGYVYQVSFVNKRIGILDPAAPNTRLPHRLDAPDNPAEPECQQTEFPGAP
jgi:hypothetical protein